MSDWKTPGNNLGLGFQVYKSIHRRKNPLAHHPNKLIRGKLRPRIDQLFGYEVLHASLLLSYPVLSRRVLTFADGQVGSLAVLRPRMRPTPKTNSPTASNSPATKVRLISAFGSLASGERTERKKPNAIRTAAIGKATLTTHLIPSERVASST